MTETQKTADRNLVSIPDLVDGDELAIMLGGALRERRKEQGLTLQQLADLCGLSQPFLSQLENGKAMPSLIALHQVAAALGTSAQELLHPSGTAEVSLVRNNSTACYEIGPGATACFLVQGANHQIETNLMVVQPGAESPCELAHDGQEVIYMIEGWLSVSVQDHDTVELHVGDTYAYPATIPHEYRNTGTDVAKFLFISTPATF